MKNEDLSQKQREAAAIRNCNEAPIHSPNKIQSFGCLVAVDFETGSIENVSKNLSRFFTISSSKALGANFATIFGAKTDQKVREALSRGTATTRREVAGVVPGLTGMLQISTHFVAKQFVVEFLPTRNEMTKTISELSKISEKMTSLSEEDDLQSILQTSVNLLKEVGLFDSVMCYRFLNDNSGEVVAHSKVDEAPSYLGLRFPAFDIPPSARELFLKLPSRVIQAVSKTDADLVSNCSEAINLSLCATRATHPAHVQYLRNMNVESSITLPIVVDGKLWGLFANHHLAEKQIPSEMISFFELANGIFNLAISRSIHQTNKKRTEEFTSLYKSLLKVAHDKNKLQEFLSEVSIGSKSLIESDGIAYLVDEELTLFGDCPDETACDAIANLPEFQPGSSELLSVENLTFEMVDGHLNDTRGFLQIELRESFQKAKLIFFRNSISQSIKWAGNPTKDIVTEKSNELRLLPRSSFSEYKASVKDQCEPWTLEDCECAKGFRLILEHLWKVRGQQDEYFELVKSNTNLADFFYNATQDLSSARHALSCLANSTAAEDTEGLASKTKTELEILRKRLQELSENVDQFLGKD